MRSSVKPETTDWHQERLRNYFISDATGKGVLVIFWEKLLLTLPIEQV